MSTYDDILEEYKRRKNGEASGTPDASSPTEQTTGGSSYDDIAAEYQRIRGGGQTAPAVQEEQPVQPARQRPVASPLRPGRAALIQDETAPQQAQEPDRNWRADPVSYLLGKAKDAKEEKVAAGQSLSQIGANEARELAGPQMPEATGPARGRGLRQIEGYEQRQRDYEAARLQPVEDFAAWRRGKHGEYAEIDRKLAEGSIDAQAAEAERAQLDERYGVYGQGSAMETWEWRNAEKQDSQQQIQIQTDRIQYEQDQIARLQSEMNEQAFDPAREAEYRQKIQEHQQNIDQLRENQLKWIERDRQTRARESEAFSKLSPDEQHYITRNFAEKAWDAVRGGSIKAFTALSSANDAIINFFIGEDGLLDMISGGMWSDLLANAEGQGKDLVDFVKTGEVQSHPYGRSDVQGNPYTEHIYKPNRTTAAGLEEKSNAIIGPDKGVELAANAIQGVEMMLPYIFLNGYLGAFGGAQTPAQAASAMRYTAAINTAGSSHDMVSLMLTRSALEMAGNPSTQYTFYQTFGDSLLEAEADGASKPQALVYALTNAALSTIIEVGGSGEGGGLEAVNRQLRVNPLQQLEPRVLAKTIIGENIEEQLQNFVGGSLKSVYQNVRYLGGEGAVLDPQKALDTLINTTIATPFITVAQVGVTHGFGRVAARVDAREQRQADRIIEAMDEAGARDEASANPESQAELIRAIEEISGDKALSRVFTKMFKTTPEVALQELRAAEAEVQPEQTEATETPAETPSVSPGADNSLRDGATGEEEGSSGTPTPTNPVRPQEAAGAPVAQGGTETAAQAAETPTAQAPVLNSNEGATAATQSAESPARTTATEATRNLAAKYGGLRYNDARGRIIGLSNLAKATDFSDPEQVRQLWSQARSDAEEIFRTAEDPSARTGGDTGNDIRSYLKGNKIKIDGRLRSDVPSRFESFQDMRNKTMGTLTFSNSEGRGLDSVYAEMGEMFGRSMFPENVYSHADMLDAILEAVENERGTRYTYEQSTPESERGRAVAELTMDLMRAAESVTGQTIPTPVQQAQQSMTAEQAREAAIQSELDADFEGDLSREEAERIVDERFEQYGEYDLDKILNSFEEETYDDEYGGEDAFDEYAYYAEQFHGADRAETGDGAAAETAADEGRGPGGETQLPATVGPRASEGGPAENDGAGAGGLREPGSAALVSRKTGLVPAGQTAAETRGVGTPSVAAEIRSDSSLTEGANGENGPKEGQKRSKSESHTLQHIAEMTGGQQEELYYTPKSERESLTNAVNRVNSDFNGEMQRLMAKEMWTGEDADAAHTIQGLLQLDGVKTGDFSAAQAWGRIVQAHDTEIARALQSLSKWTRTGAAAAAETANRLEEAAKSPTGKKNGLTQEKAQEITNDVYGFAQRFDSVEDGDLKSIRELIKDQAKFRNTGTFADKNFGRLLNQVQDFDWLKEFAIRQMLNIPADYTEESDFGQKIKTWQVNSQLSRLGSFFRNFGGNGVFGVQDTLSQDFFGVALDAMVSKFTGKRTVTVDKGWFSSDARKGARDGLVRSLLEVAGDVDMGDGGSRYGTNANRTFKMTGNRFDRFMSRWEQLLGYSLTSSDRFFRGGIEAEQLRGLSQFENLTDEERQSLARNMADYRLFQNQGWAYGLAKGAHDLLNLVGIGGKVNKTSQGRQGGFGAGDLVLPYPGVPANLGVKLLEHSPANLAKGAFQLFKLWRDVKHGVEWDVTRQQNAVMNVARGLNGTALTAALVALFKAGLIRNADDDDKDAAALAKGEGRQGVQINLSAGLRWLTGGSSEWQDGDELMKIDWLEPMNAFMSVASMMADEDNGDLSLGSMGKTYYNGLLQSVLDMPVMENFQNAIDAYNYAKGDDVGEKMGNAAISLGSSALTGLIPAPVSQTARAMDPYYRETAGDSAGDTALRLLMNAIPGLRQQLPEKLDNFGNPMEQASSAYDRWMNSFVRPGAINDYKLPDMYKALDELHERSGEAVYPDRKPPKNFSVGGEKLELTQEERQRYQEVYGNAAEQLYSQILLGDEYKDLTDAEKLWLLDQAQDYATYAARRSIVQSRGGTMKPDNTWEGAEAVARTGVQIPAYLLGKKQADTDGEGLTNQEVYDWLLNSGYSDKQQEAIWDATKGSSTKSWDEYRDTNPVTYLMNAGLSQKGAQRMYAQINTDGRSDLTQRELYQYYLAHPEAEELIREYWDNQRGFSQSWDKKKRNPDKDWTD